VALKRVLPNFGNFLTGHLVDKQENKAINLIRRWEMWDLAELGQGMVH